LITFSLEQYFNDIFAFENRGTKRNTVRNGHPGCTAGPRKDTPDLHHDCTIIIIITDLSRNHCQNDKMMLDRFARMR